MVDHYRTYQTANFPNSSWKDTAPTIVELRPQPFQLVTPHRRRFSGSSSVSGRQRNTHGHPRFGSTSSGKTFTVSTSIGTSASAQSEAYVATLRKQKATVWSERAQHEDPRILADQKAAKLRAALEVAGPAYSGTYYPIKESGLGGSSSASPASSLYGGLSGHHKSHSLTLASSKIRAVSAGKKVWKGNHGHGQVVMDPGSLIVGGVPTRLSASEVQGDSSDEEREGHYIGVRSGERRRSLSGRNSINSNHRKSFRESKNDGLHHRNSTGSKSSSSGSGYSPDESSIAEVSESPSTTIPVSHPPSSAKSSPKISPKTAPGNSSLPEVTALKQRQPHVADYFFSPVPAASGGPPAIPPRSPGRPKSEYRPSVNSHSSSNYSSGNDDLGPLIGLEKVRTPASELRRRGSVDEREARTMTMSGVRLYVANPDQSNDFN